MTRILSILSILFAAACTTPARDILPAEIQRRSDELTATAEARRTQAAVSTEARLNQLESIHDAMTMQAIYSDSVAVQLRADAATATAVMAPTQTAAAEQRNATSTRVAAVAGTPTAFALYLTQMVQATAAAEQRDRDRVGGWLWTIAPPVGLAALFVLVGLAIYYRATAEAKGKANAESRRAEGERYARRIEAQAKAQRDLALAEQTRVETIRKSVIRVGATLVRIKPDGEVQIISVPVETLPGAPIAPELPEHETIKIDGEVVDRYSPEQRAMLDFLDVCQRLNGPQANAIPTASVLEEHGINRTLRGAQVNALKSLGLARSSGGGETGGTWLVGHTIESLMDDVRSGQVSLPQPEKTPLPH